MTSLQQYKSFIQVLRKESGLRELPEINPIEVTIWKQGDDPTKTDQPPANYQRSLRQIAEMWLVGEIRGLSLGVRDEISFQTRVRCVFNCPGGKVYETDCSDNTTDYANCWDALKLRCFSERPSRHFLPRSPIGYWQSFLRNIKL